MIYWKLRSNLFHIMKYINVNIVFLLLLHFQISAQDTYHTWLQQYLKTNFNLPSPVQFAISNSEATTEALAINYGGTTSQFTTSNTSFTRATRRVISQGANLWDAGHFYKIQSNIEANDQCLIVMWMKNTTGSSKVNIFAENSTTFDKEIFTEISLSSSWQLFLLPFKSSKAYAKESLNIGLHLASTSHTVEIAGVALINYKKEFPFNQLPFQLNLPLYDGADANAAWRAKAAEDIIKNRKSNLNLFIKTKNDESGYNVEVQMVQHQFKFGTALTSSFINQAASGSVFEQKLLDLDGKGHGFNEVVFGNDLKWPAWEQHWHSPQAEILDDIKWLKSKNISLRGHNLMWPSWQYSPSDINSSKSPAYIIDRQRKHIKNLLSPANVGDACADWDVINELTTNEEYANQLKGKLGYVTGRELYAEIFKLADSLAPNATLYLNDYIALEQADNASNGIAKWQGYIDEILKAGGPIEALGLQGHFSSSPTGIPRAKEVLDQFYSKYKLPMKVTEYDIAGLVPPDIQARYMEDILTICFAHPGMQGFTMWGFWDGDHWLNNAPIFNKDWTLKPSGKAYIDLVFNKWWTKYSAYISSNAFQNIPVFKGKHKIVITSPSGKVITKEVDITKNEDVIFDLTTTSTHEINLDHITAFPNPANDIIQINLGTNVFSEPLTYALLDIKGSVVDNGNIDPHSNKTFISCSHLVSGFYTLSLKYKNGSTVKVMKNRDFINSSRISSINNQT
jgi:endo-1,4-beta-xylanase